MIEALPDKGKAERILVSRGPGSFTGVRIGIATARALGIAWNAEVSGYPTLALVSAVSRSIHPGEPVSVAMRGGHGEIFIQDFDASGIPESDVQSLIPARAAAEAKHALVVGTRAEELQMARGLGTAVPMYPDARSVFELPPSLLTRHVSPIYGRAPDAKLPAA